MSVLAYINNTSSKPLAMRRLPKELLYVARDVLRLKVRRVSLMDASRGVDQKLFEIPRNVVATNWRPLDPLHFLTNHALVTVTGHPNRILQKLEQRRRLRTIHLEALQQGELRLKAISRTNML